MDRLFRWFIMVSIAGPVGAGMAWLLLVSVRTVGQVVSGILGPYAAPVLGATFVAILIRYHPVIAGTGSDAYIGSLHIGPKPPVSNPLLSLLKIGATALTVGSGGSGGLAGPSLHIGAGIHWIIDPLFAPGGHLDERDIRTTRIVGAAAVLGAVLGAPLAAGILSVEILDRAAIDYRELPPAIMAGASGTLFFRWFTGAQPTAPGPLPVPDLLAVGALVLTALIAGAAGLALTKMMVGLHRLQRGFAPRSLTVILGAAFTGLLALLVGTEMLGWGVTESLASYAGADPVGLRGIGLAFGKVLGTAATVGTGGSGGVIGPALVIGTFVGNGVASIAGISIPGASVVGMAAALAAISNVPIAAAVMMIELFGPSATLYACIGSAFGFQIARSGVAYFSLPDRE